MIDQMVNRWRIERLEIMWSNWFRQLSPDEKYAVKAFLLRSAEDMKEELIGEFMTSVTVIPTRKKMEEQKLNQAIAAFDEIVKLHLQID